MPDSERHRVQHRQCIRESKQIVKMAPRTSKNRKPDSVYIPDMKQKRTVGYSVEAIVKTLDGVTNSG